VHVVALSADAYKTTRDQVMAVGMNGFLAKPVQPDDLEALLLDAFGAAVPDGGGATAAGAVPAATPASARPTSARTARRRFRSGDVAMYLNMAAVGELFAGVSVSRYRSLLADFFGPASDSIAQLLSALDAGDTSDLHHRAHAVKGAASSLGLQALQTQVLGIEENGPQYDRAQCDDAARQLRETIDTTKALCERMGLL
jgi:hypothetical protein